ncbi:MAG: hypothetical protein CME55_00580 [Halieaceae bacterium]|nr:hypothetical protein [Halieaceae bacterium]|tara:strand:- start:6233 stop:6448 length:216 start_codon:yes stop_codon:yes gene_type:complete
MKKKQNGKVVIRYYPDGRVVLQTDGLKGIKCETVTDDIFKKLSKKLGKGESKHTSERYEGGKGTGQTLRHG